MNRNTTKRLIMVRFSSAGSGKKRGLLYFNDGNRRLGGEKEAEGQMMERQADTSDCSGEKREQKDVWD